LSKIKQMMITLEERYTLALLIKISQELDNWFDEVNMEFLSCMSALNPSNLTC
jgi:hypothetical protein